MSYVEKKHWHVEKQTINLEDENNINVKRGRLKFLIYRIRREWVRRDCKRRYM